MPCDIKIQILTSSSDQATNQEVIGSKTLEKGISEEEPITLDRVVDAILNLSKSEREDLAQKLRSAQSVKLTEREAKKFDFISNTTPDELLEVYPALKEEFKDLIFSPEENYILVRNNSMKINGSDYYGKYFNAEGVPVFFIKGLYGAQKFFQYQKAKQLINSSLDDVLEADKDLSDGIRMIRKYYKMNSNQAVLLDFLDNKQKYKSFQIDGKTVSTVKVLSDILSSLIGTNRRNKSGLYQAIENEVDKKPNGKKYDWEVKSPKLFNVLKTYYQQALEEKGITSAEEFDKLSVDDTIALLKDLFESDVKLMQSKIYVSGGGQIEVSKEAKTKTISQTAINDAWKKFREEYNTAHDTKLTSLNKALESNLRDVNQFFVEYLGTIMQDIEGENAEVKIVEEEGKKKVKISYTEPAAIVTKQENKIITFKFPWSTLGGFHDYAYDNLSIWSPVKKVEGTDTADFDDDGMYNGVYIFEYYNPRTVQTEYAISRHLISPNSTSSIYTSLEDAKNKINQWNETHSILDNSLYILKQYKDDPRTSVLNLKDVRTGQIITSLDVTLPSIQVNSMPSFMKMLLNGDLPTFREYFSAIPRIKEINTPEKAAIFMFKFFDEINKKFAENKKENERDFKALIKKNIELAHGIIDVINAAKPKHYLVERFIRTNKGQNNFAYLRRLENDGNVIEMYNNPDKIYPTMADMHTAAEYFNKKYGVDVNVLSKEELDQFVEEYAKTHPGFSLGKDTRAFVLDGKIYINGAKANVSDMFHEMGHIFLGIVKAKNPEAYEHLINYFKDKYTDRYLNMLGSVDDAYRGFSMQDKIEEVVVGIMAQNMFKKGSLVNGFNGTDFDDEFNDMFTQIQEDFDSIIHATPNDSLDFQGLVQTLMSDSDVMKTMEKNMKLSQLVKELIDSRALTEFDC